MASFAVKFLGCKVSQADAMLARRALLAAGHTEVPEAEADLHVINTCCITSEAQAKSRQSVRRSLKGKGAQRVFVAGCAVNLDPRQFDEIDGGVKTFVGTAEDAAAAMVGGDGAQACADLEHGLLARGHAATAELPSRTRGFVKVQDGCDSSCA
ncbi:MAG TPA: hypothetical protein VGL51_04285, partial [Solirubrobacteraceae bacterium]